MNTPSGYGRRWSYRVAPAVLVLMIALALAGCGSDDESSGAGGADEARTLEQTSFFERADFERQLELAEAEPVGPADQPWRQQLDPTFVDTSAFRKAGDWHLCFSNITEGDPWRTQGVRTARFEVDGDPRITRFTYLDAGGDDNKQISDIQSLLNQNCDALIVAPFTADALTPAVQRACDSGVPVILLATEVNTDCPTSFVSSIGGYLYGYEGARFVADNVEPGDNVLALRILPGVAELEWRWGAAVEVFNEEDVNVAAVEFTEQDPAMTKRAVSDALQRFGDIDAVWMDAGAAAVPTIEAFEDAGKDVPPIVGEDENRFLQAWRDDDLTAVAPTFPNYQWRTAIIAATDILSGNRVPKDWIVPQRTISTEEDRDEAIEDELGPLFYSECGCRDLAQFPSAYQ